MKEESTVKVIAAAVWLVVAAYLFTVMMFLAGCGGPEYHDTPGGAVEASGAQPCVECLSRCFGRTNCSCDVVCGK